MSNPIRVLCVFSKLDRGGAETMCMNLYRNMDRSKVQFDFVKHCGAEGSYEREIQELGGQIYEAPRFVGYNLFSYGRWWKNHLKHHPEHYIVHGHFFTISAIYLGMAKKLGRVTIGHSHSSRPMRYDMKSRIKAVLQYPIEKVSDHCFACSERAGKWLFPHKSFVVLNNAVPTERFSFNDAVRKSVRTEFGIGDDEPVIGIVGSLAPVKNPFGTISIFKEFRKSCGKGKLLWIGAGDLYTQIEETIRQEGIADSVIMTGVRSDVDRLLQAMDVFILPSFTEGLPVVLVEAQAAGLPCLVSEAVTKDTDLTGLCKFLPLDDYMRWADEISVAVKKERRDTSAQIAEAGYDIQTTAKWLEEFYLNCEKKQKEL